MDQALFAVVMEAYVQGVSTRKVDDLVRALGADSGISKSEVSRICANLDEDVAEFRERRLDDTSYPYVFVDATYCKARVGRRVVSQAIVIAVGVAADGRRQVLGFQVGDTESEPFWTEFFRDLKDRGAVGDQRRACRPDPCDRGRVPRCGMATMPGTFHAQRAGQGPESCRADGRGDHPHDLRAAWQERARACPVRGSRHDAGQIPSRRRPAPGRRERRSPRVHRVPVAALAADLVYEPARARQQKDQATYQRCWYVPEALLRLTGHVLIEQHDEWDAAERRYFSENSMKLITPGVEGVMFAGLEAA